MAPPLLAVETLTVERGGRVVLSELGFTLEAGETLLVTGRNGAGKSTLLRTLAGLLQPVSGRIRYGLADDEQRGVESVHYLGYEDALKPSLTVRENLEFWAAMLSSPLQRGRGTTRNSPLHPGRACARPGAGSCGEGLGVGVISTAHPLAEKHTLDPHPCPSSQGGGEVETSLAAYGIARLIDLPAAYLSAGQKRRVALARLLVAPRPIWLLDEPLIALDTAAQERTIAIMAAHTAAGGAILVASHQPLAATRRIELDRAEVA